MQEKKLEVGDWVRIKRNLIVHEIGDKYLGKIYRVVKINPTIFGTCYYLSCSSILPWGKNSLIPVGSLSRLIEARKENYEI